MRCLVRRILQLLPVRRLPAQQLRPHKNFAARSPLRFQRPIPDPSIDGADEKSEWWAMDGEMHEIGEKVPPRERFRIGRRTSNRSRKLRREQFMDRTRLILRDSDQESWCAKYIGLYQSLRDKWERLYWDEGYSNELAAAHANHDSAEDDDRDFSPYRQGQLNVEHDKMQDHSFGRRHDPFRKNSEFDRERQLTRKGTKPFAPFVDEKAPSHGCRFWKD